MLSALISHSISRSAALGGISDDSENAQYYSSGALCCSVWSFPPPQHVSELIICHEAQPHRVWKSKTWIGSRYLTSKLLQGRITGIKILFKGPLFDLLLSLKFTANLINGLNIRTSKDNSASLQVITSYKDKWFIPLQKQESNSWESDHNNADEKGLREIQVIQ